MQQSCLVINLPKKNVYRYDCIGISGWKIQISSYKWFFKTKFHQFGTKNTFNDKLHVATMLRR
jgi:hypothetical protein